MPKVLVVSPRDLQPELGDTILWRGAVERVFVPSPAAAVEVVRTVAPHMVVVDGVEVETVSSFIRTLRADPSTRSLSVAVLSRSASLADEEAFRRAGANAVLSGHLDPFLWDDRLEELLNVPPRRQARIPVRSEVWSRFAPEDDGMEGLGLNISLHGLLLETNEPIDLGTKLDLSFNLPDGDQRPLLALGQVVRDATPREGLPRCGVEFLILRGTGRERIRNFVDGRLAEPRRV